MVIGLSAEELPATVQQQIAGFTPLRNVAELRAASTNFRKEVEVCLVSLDGLRSIMCEMATIGPQACTFVCIYEDAAGFMQQLASEHFSQRPGEPLVPFGP